MSRSYKHTPRSGDTKDKFFKKYANRRLRQIPLDTPSLNNGSYKKHFCRYDICDYETVGMTFEEYWMRCVKIWYEWSWKYEPFPDRDETYREYCKWFIRK